MTVTDFLFNHSCSCQNDPSQTQLRLHVTAGALRLLQKRAVVQSEAATRALRGARGTATSFKRPRRPRHKETEEPPQRDARQKAPEYTVGQPPGDPVCQRTVDCKCNKVSEK